MLGIDPTIVVLTLFIASMWVVTKLSERKRKRNKNYPKFP